MKVKTQKASLLLTATFGLTSTALLQGSYSKDLAVMPNPYHYSEIFWGLIFQISILSEDYHYSSVHKPLFLFLHAGSRREGSEGAFLLTSSSMELWLFSSFVHFPPIALSLPDLCGQCLVGLPKILCCTNSFPQGNLHPFRGGMAVVQLSLQGNTQAFLLWLRKDL